MRRNKEKENMAKGQTPYSNGKAITTCVKFDVPVMKGPKWYSLKKDLRLFITGTSSCCAN